MNRIKKVTGFYGVIFLFGNQNIPVNDTMGKEINMGHIKSEK